MAWLAGPEGQTAEASQGQRLGELLVQLEPLCLGLYWPLAGEFNAAAHLSREEGVQWALPYVHKSPRRMEYRMWREGAPMQADECGIESATGAVVVPDVVLVPCVGFTREGFRLGYGGGYFDRWLSEHPGVTSVGLAWSVCEAPFAVEAHDQAVTLILTAAEVIAP